MSGLLRPTPISLRVIVNVSAPAMRPLTSMKQQVAVVVLATRCRSPCCWAASRSDSGRAPLGGQHRVDGGALDALGLAQRGAQDRRSRSPRSRASRPAGTTSAPPTTTGGSGESWRSRVELVEPALEAGLELVGALAGAARVHAAAVLPASSWSFSSLARWSQCWISASEPLADGGGGALDPVERAAPDLVEVGAGAARRSRGRAAVARGRRVQPVRLEHGRQRARAPRRWSGRQSRYGAQPALRAVPSAVDVDELEPLARRPGGCRRRRCGRPGRRARGRRAPGLLAVVASGRPAPRPA